MQLETADLILLATSPSVMRDFFAGPEVFQQKHEVELAAGMTDFWNGVPQEFIDKMLATSADQWPTGFFMIHKKDGVVIGQLGFKGPADAVGAAEIAYAVVGAYQNRGYATQALRAVSNDFLDSGRLKTIRAHTLPEQNASAAILKKCGFGFVGIVQDPEDGPVWRWEKVAA